MANPTLLILAAGMGSRYGGLKLMDPVGPNGESIVEYSIHDARNAGFGRIVFAIRGDMEQAFKARICARFGKRLAVEYVYQDVAKLPHGFQVPAGRTKPWGTTQAILIAEKAVREPFAVINVDDFYGAGSYRAMARHLSSGTAEFALAGFVLRNTVSEFGSVARAVCQVDQEGYLRNIVEYKNIEREGPHVRNVDEQGMETKLSGNELVSTNMWGFTPQVFGGLREHFGRFLETSGRDLKSECFIPSTVNEMLLTGEARVKMLHSADAWFGVTYQEDHARAVAGIRRLIEAGHYPRALWR